MRMVKDYLKFNYSIQLSIILLIPFFGFSQSKDTIKTIKMDEIIISATKSEKALFEVTIPAQIITSEEIKSSGFSRLNEIINEQSGLITTPTFGGGEGIQLQGIDSDYILVLINGFPLLGRVAGDFDLSRISLNSIKKIEIIKGASSSLYGSEALGGVINIITKPNKDIGFNKSLSYKVASFNTHDLSVELGYNKKKILLSSDFNFYTNNGYDLIDGDNQNTVEPFKNFTGNLNVDYNLPTIGSFKINHRLFLEKKLGTTFITEANLNPKTNIFENNFSIKYSNEIFKNLFSYIDYYSTNYNAEETSTSISNNVNINNQNDFFQKLNRIDIRFKYINKENSIFTFGFGFDKEKLRRTNIKTEPKHASEFIYFQYDWYLNNKLNIVTGSRYDHHNQYNSQISPKLSFKYNLTNNLNIKASVGYGYKAPDFRQLYLDFSNSSSGYLVLGYNVLENTIKQLQENDQLLFLNDINFNNNLNAENSVSYNIGLQYFINPNLPIEVNLFRNNIKDLIDTQIVGRKKNGQTIFSYYNVNKSYTEGFEISSSWNPTKKLKINIGYQLLYAKDQDVQKAFNEGLVFARDKKTMNSFQLNSNDYYGLYGKSRNISNLKIKYQLKKINSYINLRLIYRGKFGLLDSNNNTYLDKYDTFINDHIIVNSTFNKTIKDKISVQITIENMLGYQDIINLLNNPGRKYSLNLFFKF